MKRLLSLFPALLISLSAFAQGINAEYDRNSLTVFTIHHNDRYDAISDAYLSQSFPGGEKFDNNMLDIRHLDVNYTRFIKSDAADIQQYMRLNAANVEKELKAHFVSLQIVGKWFNRSPEGRMDLNLINQRSDYNATDKTYNIASSQALGEYLLHGDGVKLVDNSYILVVDHSVPERSEYRDRDGKITSISYSTQAIGYLYKIAFGELQRQAVYDLWIYPEDDSDVRKAKLEKWDKLFIPTNLTALDIASSSASIDPRRNSDETPALRDAVQGCASALINEFEKTIEAWKVKTTIYKTHPIQSKVGTKEGIKNMSRFEVREYVLDGKGNVDTRRRGYVRATTIVNNTRATKGSSGASRFYQIAGGKLEPGMLLKEKKSANLDVKALYYGGALKGFGAEVDIMFGMTDGGSVNHVRISGAYNGYKDAQLSEPISGIGVRMGYGYGLRPFRQLEVIPGAYVLGDYLGSKSTTSTNESEKSMLRKMAFGLEAGLDLNITIFYPVKINAGAFYSLPILKGALYKDYSEILNELGQKREGFTWRAGLVYEF